MPFAHALKPYGGATWSWGEGCRLEYIYTWAFDRGGGDRLFWVFSRSRSRCRLISQKWVSNHMGMLYLFEKCMERVFECNLSWDLTHRYVKMLGRTRKMFWFQRADLAVLLAACAGNQQWSGDISPTYCDFSKKCCEEKRCSFLCRIHWCRSHVPTQRYLREIHQQLSGWQPEKLRFFIA